MDVQFRVNGPYLRNLRTTYDLPELIRGDPRGSHSPPKVDFGNPPSHAGGQDDVSSTQLPQTIIGKKITLMAQLIICCFKLN